MRAGSEWEAMFKLWRFVRGEWRAERCCSSGRGGCQGRYLVFFKPDENPSAQLSSAQREGLKKDTALVSSSVLVVVVFAAKSQLSASKRTPPRRLPLSFSCSVRYLDPLPRILPLNPQPFCHVHVICSPSYIQASIVSVAAVVVAVSRSASQLRLARESSLVKQL